jgi:hypothetical protein
MLRYCMPAISPAEQSEMFTSDFSLFPKKCTATSCKATIAIRPAEVVSTFFEKR